MNAFYGLAIAASLIHGILFDGSFWKIYFCNLFIYTLFVMLTRSTKENPKRKTLMIATWNGKHLKTFYYFIESSNPTSFICEDINVTKALEYIKDINEV